mmetsp:Transcript_33958/g.54064  ORF Transcript_33958/g.54064 Transcript_33958/m.54064 type:complete len:476 (-) Transcript_33958:71-1498(-)|eukprot:CAMPEP_0169104182 /NCGR_PEP_ID=MMETSP1015-20121227/23117_1 /TAXON_ID=342587 /ORGANISM="Karlodinium micrum, Strain CCMP2283" /LENGTH=475 /DNA_ID=CAMNT_0009165439 /DNA_START=46 /DNA_END=1473 /DNA_ORIENTATION=-
MQAAPPSDNVWIGNLPSGLDGESLNAIFQAYGEIVQSRVLPVKDPSAPSSAMIRFASVDMATWVVESLNNNIPEGLEQPILVRFANAPGAKDAGKGVASAPTGGGAAPPSDNVWIGSLPAELDQNTLHNIFQGYGQIVESRLMPPKEDGAHACAMIRFQSVEAATWVVENLNSNIPEGLSTPVIVRFANAPAGKDGSKGKQQWPPSQPASAPGIKGWGAPQPGSFSQDNVWFGDLPPGMDGAQLEQILSAYGQIISSKMLPGKDPEAFSCAMVRFASAEMAKWVVDNLNGNIPEGLETPVVCRFANASGGKDQSKGACKGSAPYPGGAVAPAMNGKGPKGGKCGKGNTFRGLMDGVKGAGIIVSGIIPEENQVYIRGLPSDTTDVDLYRLFSSFGAIAPTGVKAMLTDDRTACKGIGFVDFLDANAAATAALALDGFALADGTPLQVTSKQPKAAKGDGKSWGDGKGKGGGKKGW